jgi:protein TonB
MNKIIKWLYRPRVMVGFAVCLLIAGSILILKNFIQKPPQTKRTIQQITVFQPPPPPPPPPPEQKPPEPEIKEEKIEKAEPEPEKEPEQAPENAEEPQGDQLGVDGEGSAGSDAFGLAGRKGGRSLLGGSAGSAIQWYGGQVRRGLEEELHGLLEDTHARKNNYSVVLNIWIGPDGQLSRAELASGSGKQEVDQALRLALPRMKIRLQKAPPENMPQPIKIRLNSRL